MGIIFRASERRRETYGLGMVWKAERWASGNAARRTGSLGWSGRQESGRAVKPRGVRVEYGLGGRYMV